MAGRKPSRGRTAHSKLSTATLRFRPSLISILLFKKLCAFHSFVPPNGKRCRFSFFYAFPLFGISPSDRHMARKPLTILKNSIPVYTQKTNKQLRRKPREPRAPRVTSNFVPVAGRSASVPRAPRDPSSYSLA